MTAILPESELLRRAAVWICEKREERPDTNLYILLDEAGMRFNLSPKEQQMLADVFSKNNCPTAEENAGGGLN